MKPQPHRRSSLRLSGYDYSQPGVYFLTIVTKDRAILFGDIVDKEMKPNTLGQIVLSTWDELTEHYSGIALGTFCLMPNHVHGIVVINDFVGAGLRPAPTRGFSLSEIVRAFKSFSTRRINLTRNMSGVQVWQRGYYDHIIRSEKEHQAIHDYILTNPLNWQKDDMYHV